MLVSGEVAIVPSRAGKFRPRWFYRERMIHRRIEYLLAKRTLHRLIHAELRAMGLRDKRVRVELRAAQMRLASTK